MKKIAGVVYMVLALAGCGGAKDPVPVAGDIDKPDGITVTDGTGEDGVIPPDTVIPRDTPIPDDTTIPETTVPDAPPDAAAPAGCCVTDADCNDPVDGSIMVCAGHGLGEPAWAGVCVLPAGEAGRCRTDGECQDGQVCYGAMLCGCGVDCDMEETPGICVTPGAACQAIKPSWTEEICDAAGLVVWDGQACVHTCPGCCGCQGWCGYTFQTIDDCEATCHPAECPLYVAALADTHFGFFTGDDGCPALSPMTVTCEDDPDCAVLADAGLPGFGETCVLGNCAWCWNDDECLPGTACRAGRCVEHAPFGCPDPGPCADLGCNLITPSEAPCPVCTCESIYGLPCETDMDCLPISFHPFSRCVYGRCADCRNDADCDWGRCMQPGICYEMTPPEDMLFGTWLIGWSGGLDHYSYFRFEADGTFRRAMYDTSDPVSSFADDVPPLAAVCDPGWPVPAPLVGTWEPEVTESGFLVIRVRLNLPCATDHGWTVRWALSPLEGGPWTMSFDDIDGDMDLYGWQVDGTTCLPDFSECPLPVNPW